MRMTDVQLLKAVAFDSPWVFKIGVVAAVCEAYNAGASGGSYANLLRGRFSAIKKMFGFPSEEVECPTYPTVDERIEAFMKRKEEAQRAKEEMMANKPSVAGGN